LDITLACDIMMDLEGSVRPAVHLARELARRGYHVSIMASLISKDVIEQLRLIGVTPINLRANLATRNSYLSLLWFETWAREAILRLNSRNINNHSEITVNFSHTLIVPSLFWYVQGPTSVALKDMEKELTSIYRFAYIFLKPLIASADSKLVSDMGRKSAFVVANSKFCASMYQKWGIRVSGIIYPPIDCKIFQPRTLNPSSDYVLTYFGKETKFSVIKTIANLGVRIKGFGGKAPFIPRSLRNHSNIEFLGRVSTQTLVNLYSNALFTLFPFTHEPFGYVPVESMACGTPVLTYNMQGPREAIIDESTGWLVQSDNEMIRKALEIWKKGYSSSVRLKSVEVAQKFSTNSYIKNWLTILEKYF
jgi:glycosyltransferase involved in cell wall biosynthesis